MCTSLVEGGRRCAAHTRPGFQALIAQASGSPRVFAEALDAGFGDLVAHARTRSGADEVAEQLQHLRTRFSRTADLVPAHGDAEGWGPEDQVAGSRVLAIFERAVLDARQAEERAAAVEAEVATHLDGLEQRQQAAREARQAARWARYPSVTGEGTIDLADLQEAAHDPEWIDTWNETPQHLRRPLRLFHGTTNPHIKFRGYAHFGDEWAASSRVANTVDFDVQDGYMVEVDYTGDLSYPVSDMVANQVAHDSPILDIERATEECRSLHTTPQQAAAYAEDFWEQRPEGALLYLNSVEGEADGVPSFSVVLDTSVPDRDDLVMVTVRPFTDEDWDRGFGCS